MSPISDAAGSFICEQRRGAERELKRWVPAFNPVRRPVLRLFCFPYAGTGASAFRDWHSELPGAVGVLPVQLPGRESRWHEPAFLHMAALADRLVKVLTPLLDQPYAIFGHSMGGLIAFELARQLRRADLPRPAHIFISSTRAPHVPDRELPLHLLPDSVFLAELARRFEVPPDRRTAELAQALLPTLRADFALCETYYPGPEQPLDVPITVYGGRSDRMVVYSDLVGWSAYTMRGFKLQMFPGDHFPLHQQRAIFLRTLSADLTHITNKLDTAT